MKTYKQFLNENEAHGEFNNKLLIGFRFSVDFTNITKEQYLEFATEMRKYFVFEKYGMLTYPTHDPKPWAWSFEISVGGRGVDLEYWPVTSNKSNFYVTDAGVKFLEKMLTIDEFLSVGFEGVRNFIKMKNDMNKFNL